MSYALNSGVRLLTRLYDITDGVYGRAGHSSANAPIVVLTKCGAYALQDLKSTIFISVCERN